MQISLNLIQNLIEWILKASLMVITRLACRIEEWIEKRAKIRGLTLLVYYFFFMKT